MAPGQSSPEEFVIYSSGNTGGPPDLRFLHYNDVYHVDSSSAEPVGGFARFKTLCNYYRNDVRFRDQPGLLTFFSGDAFNPSVESSVTKGSHMVPVLNSLGTDVACVGNHDLDFGIKQFRYLTGLCHFPWLLANVIDPSLGEDEPIGSAKKTVMLTSSNGIKIGVIGLGEREWLDTINVLPPDLIYKSASKTAQDLIPRLRAAGADIIVAITHQREPNDNKLAESVPEGLIDIILGGHDHYYNHSFINGTHVLRSGSDFKQLSYIEGRRKKDGSAKWDLNIVRRDVTSDVPEDQASVDLIEKLTASLKAKLAKPIGYTAAGLDARFRTVRLKESNLGNFVCDLMRYHYNADACIMAAGTIRGDQVYPPGVLRLKDILDCFPFEDPVVVLKVKGKAILDALENSVSKFPALEGRFPQVSNIVFEFNPEKPPGSRIVFINIGNEPLDREKEYHLATRGYMARGKDGYDALLAKSEGGTAEEIVSEENGVLISTIMRQYFMSLKVLGKWKRWSPSLRRHWSSIHAEVSNVHPCYEPSQSPNSMIEAFKSVPRQSENSRSNVAHHRTGSETPLNGSDTEDERFDPKAVSTAAGQREQELVIMRKVMRKWTRIAGLKNHPTLCDSLGEGEFTVNWTKAIAPRIEGRIRQAGVKSH